MHYLKFVNNSYQFTNTKNFVKLRSLKKESIMLAFNFAYNMSFGGLGKHRDHRSGGDYKRKNGEIFSNTFQGKLAEFGIYNIFYKFNIPYPDLETYDLGLWDKYDFKINNKKIAVKSTKSFGQLLLLETKDWNTDGKYIPNLNTENDQYDYFILVRINGEHFTEKITIESLMKKHKLLYSDKANKMDLQNIILSCDWSYDIPGFITHQDLISIIKNKFILPKGSFLGKNTIMDANNYYVQSGDMHDLNNLFILL